MQLLSFETATWGSPLPSGQDREFPNTPSMENPPGSCVLPPSRCSPRSQGFSLSFRIFPSHSHLAAGTAPGLWWAVVHPRGSPSCCLHFTRWFRGILSIKKPQRSKIQTAPCVNAQNVLLEQCPKAQISCPLIEGVSRLSLALNHYYFPSLVLRNRGFQLRFSHQVDHLTTV